jgi:putative hemolysin
MAAIVAAGAARTFSGTDLALVVIVVILIFFSAFLALSETALTRVSRVKALALAEEGRRGAPRLLRLVEHMDRTLPVVLFTLELSTLVAATLVGVVADHLFGPFGVVIATAFEVIFIFVVAELAPKTWAVQHAERAALFAAPFMAGLVGFPPLRWITHALIKVSNALLPGKGLREGPYVTEGELLAMADTAAEADVIETDERTLIHSIIDFGDTVAREVMVPRPDMVTVDARARISDAADIATTAGFSRIPVYGMGIDDIIGVVFLKDLMRAEREGRGEDGVTEIMREAQFIPESKRIARVMKEMQASKQHLAIVVDEYGGTAGLITLEDVIEELVGEIEDEYDVDTPAIERLADGEASVDARLAIDEVNEELDAGLPEGDWDTVGGLVYSLLGHVPTEGEEVHYGGRRLVAQQVEGRRIGRVLIGVSREVADRDDPAIAVGAASDVAAAASRGAADGTAPEADTAAQGGGEEVVGRPRNPAGASGPARSPLDDPEIIEHDGSDR